MNMIKLLLTGTAAFLSLTGVASALPVTVNNGDFESQVAPATSFLKVLAGQSGVSQWNVVGKDVLLINTNYKEGTLTFNAKSGNQALDLTGGGNSGPTDGVTQDFATVAGQQYSISFYVGRASASPVDDRYNTPSTIAFSTDGGLTRELFTNSDATANQINWKPFTTSFFGTGGNVNLGFYNATAILPTGNHYAGLDLVTIQAVPEPASVALFAIGAVVVGAGSYRRRRKPSVAC